MTIEDIIRMAQEAGFDTDLPGFQDGSAIAIKLAALVAAAAKAEEREACAKVLDEMAAQDKRSNYYQVAAAAIRARNKQ